MLIYHYLSGFIRNTQLLGKTQIYKCSGKHTPRNDMLNQSPLCILFQSNLEASGLASILGRQTGNGGSWVHVWPSTSSGFAHGPGSVEGRWGRSKVGSNWGLDLPSPDFVLLNKPLNLFASQFFFLLNVAIYYFSAVMFCVSNDRRL